MRLQITCQDRVGIAKNVLAVLVDQEINIKGIDAITESGQIYVHIPDLEFSHLQKFMPRLRLIDGVIDVKTTTFMPSERSRNVLDTIVRTLPDPVFSIDARANIYGISDVVLKKTGLEESEIVGQPIGTWIKGFNFIQYLEGDETLAQTRKLKFNEEDFVADILPITVMGEQGEKVLTGALLLLKSEARLGQQVIAFKHQTNDFTGIVQKSPLMRKVIREARRMANLDSSILITGETGTGKELLARSCHNVSERCDSPFVVLNCATFPDEASESELFGKKTSETETHKGIFELAEGGTIFLDGVSQMSEKLQSKLVRVIEDGCFRRIDDELEIKVNIRFISATNTNLLEKVEKGLFKEELFYRLNVLSLNIPPLRERTLDIPTLAEHFVYKSAQVNHRQNINIDKQCMAFIEQYPWPGNIRQLKNVLLRAVALIEDDSITVESLKLPNFSKKDGYLNKEFEGTLEDAVKTFEADVLRKLYPAFPSTRQLAKKLGLSHTAVANKLREYNINKKTVKT